VIAADVVWRFAGRGPVSGEHRGIDAVLGAFAEIAQRSGGTFRVELHDVLANDEHAVALVERTARHNGRELRSRGADVFHIRGGQVVEYWDCPTDAHAEEEFWA
ncbi:MAG: nuclear transport factor 2 family protein, partial [Solirubrobacteraceae bacterium]